ncbi:MAG: aromatic ring-hydroxylating dioxygenase subunit alpha [Aquisalinus sp.]|nr:aromatic ring-hydroxylating dioxygenase subunit alpha [Aquisalinus sp.]
MDRSTEIRLIKEILDLHEKGETQYAPASSGATTDLYTSEEIYKREMSHIFKANPNAVAITSQLPEAGSYIAREWVDNFPLLLVRDQKGDIRAFANICRHRNSRLVDPGEGCRKRFTCPYHAWTYATDGRLVAAPQFDAGFPDRQMEEFGLIELSVAVVHGLIFVHPDPTQKIADDFLPAEMRSTLAWLDLENHRVYDVHDQNWKSNWKIMYEGGIEAYHFNVAHKDTIAPFFLGNLSTWEGWGHYSRFILPKKSILDCKDQPEEKWDIRQGSNILVSLYPTLTFLVQPDHISGIMTTPLAPGLTRVEEITYAPKPADGSDTWSEEEETLYRTNHDLTKRVLDEDYELGETIQANMETGIVPDVNFARFESALTELHRHYNLAMQ